MGGMDEEQRNPERPPRRLQPIGGFVMRWRPALQELRVPVRTFIQTFF